MYNTGNKFNELLSNNVTEEFKKIGIPEKTTSNFKKKSFSLNHTSNSNNFIKSKFSPNNTVGYSNFNIQNKPTFLMTALNFSTRNNKNYFYDSSYPLVNIRERNEEIAQNKIFIPVEAKKVNFKLKGFNVHKDKLAREIRKAEMLPLLKNKTYHQMREFFDIKIPISKEIEKKHRKDINSYSLKGKQNEKKLMGLIAHGNTEIMKYLSLFKLKQILGS